MPAATAARQALATGDLNATLPGTAVLTSGTTTLSNAVTFRSPGSQYLAASDNAAVLQGTQRSISVSAAAVGAPVRLGITAASSVVAGVSTSLTVKAYDAANNLVSAYRGTVHVSSSDPNATLPSDYAFVTGDAGSKALAVTLASSGNRLVTCTDGNNSLTGNTTILVVPAAAQKLALTAATTSTAGQAFSVNVAALDGFSNVATGYTGTVSFSSSDANAVLPQTFILIRGHVIVA